MDGLRWHDEKATIGRKTASAEQTNHPTQAAVGHVDLFAEVTPPCPVSDANCALKVSQASPYDDIRLLRR
jgi:hypothetical protein